MINSLNLTSFVTLFSAILILPICFCSSDNLQWYDACGSKFTCGNVNAGFPFWGGSTRPSSSCGYPDFKLSCNDDNSTMIVMKNMTYHVLDVNQISKILRIVRHDFESQGLCLQELVNTTLNFEYFNYAQGSQNITVFYGCPVSQDTSGGYGPPTSSTVLPAQFNCRLNGFSSTLGSFQEGAAGPSGCHASVVVPVLESQVSEINDSAVGLRSVIDHGFEASYKLQDEALCLKCGASNGRCGFDVSTNKATCLCPDGTSGSYSCSSTRSNASVNPGKKPSKTGIILGLSFGGGLLAALVIACCFIVQRRRRIVHQSRTKDIPSSLAIPPSTNGFYSSQGYTTSPSTYMSQSLPSYGSSKSNLDNSSYLGVKVFSYTELEQATANFNQSRELGDGGFGTVYYGELPDGRSVAVKRLYENSIKRMGQFKNEIAILANLRHKNLVALYGCTPKRSRDLLLVYEYVPNGTVADHLHGRQAAKLPWCTRLSIAVETAEALSFLHENDVIHRDVKTTNILLDNNFTVKVADFGLSRLFPNDVTHVSTAPQGTPGYVDPDYYQCYHLTEKSDVYSFGVVLMELVSSKVAVDITRHRHDINLANMAVDRIQKHCLQELVDPSLGYDKDYLVQKMVTLVAELAFQCLQQDKEMRPSMKEVFESLKGMQKEMVNAQKQVVVDIQGSDDDVGLLKNDPPPLSPETEVNDSKVIWMMTPRD